MNTDEIFDMNSENASGSEVPLVINKHKNLFDELEKAENKNKHRISYSQEPMEADNEERGIKRKRSETKQFRGKESIFKRPEQPISKCLPVRKLPDFQRNPRKWTKYSLDTVRGEDMSEKGNTAAALSFLKELEERKAQEYVTETSVDEKPVFNVTALIPKEDVDETDEKCSFKGSKIVMPEYVVGQKKKVNKKPTLPKEDLQKTKEIKLDHLLEYEDE